MRYTPHNYQQHAFEHIIRNPFCGLFLDMGLGKTIITLTAINRLMYEECDLDVNRVLVIAPKRVVRTVWKQEAMLWDHTNHLKISIVWGRTVKERIAALRTKADIYLINREMVTWLVSLFQSKFPFKMVVIDESSGFKAHNSQRFRSLKMVRKYIKRMVLLTGTPAPNSLIDLWAPMYLLDEGERLEKNISGYRERYFTLKNPGELFSGYRPRRGSAETIYQKIGDICISMKKEDYLDLPPLIENDVFLELDDNIQAKYDEFEEESIIELMGEEITAMNAAALTTKLLQFSSGAMYYVNSKEYAHIHDTKLDALEELIEEAQGKNVFVAYTYRHSLERIRKRFPHLRVISSKNPEKDVEDWNAGKIPLLVAHPASAGHGLNLQKGGHIIIWFDLTWSSELYRQFVARLDRQGQEQSVIVHRLITRKTIDIEVAKALKLKIAGESALMEAIKALVQKYKPNVNKFITA